MLKIKPPSYKYCPFCGKKLQSRMEEGKKRRFCSSCGWTYYPHVAIAVAALIVRKEKVLMVKRKRKPSKDTWVLPAGYIDFGEHPLEALKREVKEETGLDVKKTSFLEVLQADDDPREPGHFVFFYRVTVSGSKIKTDEEENKEIAWVDLKNLPKIGFSSHEYMVKKLISPK